MNSVENRDEIEVNNQTWNKLQNVASKTGYRDGISAGRESNFQKSFDDGFCEGFKSGFALGIYKGVLSCVKDVDEEMLQKITRGNCVICKEKDLENKPSSELIKLQTEHSNIILGSLNEKYCRITAVSLPNKLN